MLREYIVSEAMHARGADHPRALAVVATGKPVFRDTPQPGRCWPGWRAATLRVAASSTSPRAADIELLRRVADHAIARHHPAAAGAGEPWHRWNR